MFRSLLFVPGNREEMLGKAGALPADVLVPDLEDAVPWAEKDRARALVGERVRSLAQRGQLVVPRINGLETGRARQDLNAVVCGEVFGVTVGKVSSPWEVVEVARILEELEGQRGVPVGHTRLIPWLESAQAVVHAYAIASASPRVVGVAFGAEDFTNDMGVRRTEAGAEVAYARSAVAVAAQAADVLAIDTPYVNFRDAEGLEQECRLASSMGFKAKFAIHPSQLDTINALFSPSDEEVAYARRMVQAFQEAVAQGRGTISLDGKMVDLPVVKRAQKLLARAESLGKRDPESP
ncbi:MAG: CoA ester lyase [Chloroflexi bacterium]|nr:CoA ester lyase [Chloroflexota bacterium]